MTTDVKQAVIDFVKENEGLLKKAKELKEKFDYEVKIQTTGDNDNKNITVEYWYYNPLTDEIKIKTSFFGIPGQCFSSVEVGLIEIKRFIYPDGKIKLKINRIINFTDHWSSVSFLATGKKERFKSEPEYKESFKIENLKKQEKIRKTYPQKTIKGAV